MAPSVVSRRGWLAYMSARKRKYTDDEIESQTLERLNDPDAWEAPVYVPPLAFKRPSWVTLGRDLGEEPDSHRQRK